MIKQILQLFIILSIISCSKKTANVLNDDFQNITIDISYLASDELEGREIGTKGEQLAAEYISGRFQEMGIKPYFSGYFQPFSKKIKTNPHANEPAADDPEIKGKNVIAHLDNGKQNTIIIGAHFDHLGYGNEGSLYAGEKAIHNGADDNASGVAMMLFLAEMLKSSPLKNSNVIFIAFSGEEKGLWGSNFFVNNSSFDPKKINFMLNLDMVGRLNKDKQIAISGVGTSAEFSALLDKHNKYGLKIKKTESGVGPSDHTSFYLRDIPVLALFTGQHDDYHKPSDDIQNLNFNGMKLLSSYALDLIRGLDGKKLIFQKTKDESTESPKFTVGLGVIPDYLFDGKGMKVDGVREGKPAHKADLQKGDVVIKMNDMEVFDMMSYMKALATFKKGDNAKLTILRDNKEMIKEVKFE